MTTSASEKGGCHGATCLTAPCGPVHPGLIFLVEASPANATRPVRGLWPGSLEVAGGEVLTDSW